MEKKPPSMTMVKVRGDPEVVPPQGVICAVNPARPFSAVYPHLAAKLGRRSLAGLEVLAPMPDGRLRRINTNAPPQEYGVAPGEEWAVFLRNPPIPECPFACTVVSEDAERHSNTLRMEWSRKPSDSPAAAAPAVSGKRTRLSFTRRVPSSLKAPADPAEAAAELLRSGFTVADSAVSRELSAALLQEALGIHLRGHLSTSVTPPGCSSPQEETYGGAACWVTASHHPCIRKWLRVVDRFASGMGLGLKDRTPALVSCYPAGGAGGTMHADDTFDRRRKVTVTLFLRPAASAKPSPKPTAGALRILAPQADALVSSLPGRLVIHWSDGRCRHEILPTASLPHYAITVWYYAADPSESRRVHIRNSALLFASARAVLAAALVIGSGGTVLVAKERRQKKKRDRKRKKKLQQQHQQQQQQRADSDDDDEDDDDWDDYWVFVGSLRAGIVAALACSVLSVPRQPPPPPAPPVDAAALCAYVASLEDVEAAFRIETQHRRRIEDHMRDHEARVQQLMSATLASVHKLVREAVASEFVSTPLRPSI